MSQLVRLQGKHTTQTAHCAVAQKWMHIESIIIDFTIGETVKGGQFSTSI